MWTIRKDKLKKRMKYLTLEAIKRQIRMEQDFHDEDDWLEETGEAEEEAMLNLLGRSYENLIETYGKVPPTIVKSTLELVDISYQHRSPVSQQNMYLVPYTFDMRVKPYIKLADDNEQSNNKQYGCKNL